MNGPEIVVEAVFCPLGPASVFGAWGAYEGTVGLWQNFCGEEPLDVKVLSDPDYWIKRHGFFFLLWKPRYGEWQRLVVREKKGGREYTCSSVVHVRGRESGRSKYVFLLDNGSHIVEKTPLKLRQEYTPSFETREVNATALR